MTVTAVRERNNPACIAKRQFTRVINRPDRRHRNIAEPGGQIFARRETELVIIAAAQYQFSYLAVLELMCERLRYRQRINVHVRTDAACGQQFLQVAV